MIPTDINSSWFERLNADVSYIKCLESVLPKWNSYMYFYYPLLSVVWNWIILLNIESGGKFHG